MPVVGTKAAASSQGFGEFAQASTTATYIEDVFSTWLYTGNGSTQTITNGIDLAGKGGLTWIKNRGAAQSHGLSDTARGAGNWMSSDLTVGNIANNNGGVSAFTSSGFSVNTSDQQVNGNGNTYASWTFRKQPKFFDVVTFTSNGTGGATINHSLGSAPGCVIVKSTATTGNWFVYHIGMDPAEYMFLNTTAAAANGGRTVTTSSTQVTYPSGYLANSTAYVAYLFASDAGGFGLTGADNVVSCGVYTGNGSATGPVVSLGYEPQWLLIKKADGAGGAWWITDTMRGFSVTSDQFLWANSSSAEFTKTNYVKPTATGFQIVNVDFDVNESGARYIYIAIRRGPMKTPTSGTSVFAPVTYTGDGTNTLDITAGFPVDMFLNSLTNVADERLLKDRLRGGGVTLSVTETTAESTSYTIGFDSNTQILNMPASWYSQNGVPYVDWLFRRAPGFFDEVCYTGTGSTRYVDHNLTVAPELLIVKNRSAAPEDWSVYAAPLGNTSRLKLNLTDAVQTGATQWGSTTPTATQFRVGTQSSVNGSGNNLVAYLFASCPGVSKVGSYSGTGALQTINCGFTSGARFVLIKRTDSTGDWYVYDSARGITSGNDPYLLLNTQSAQVTNTNYVDADSTGFKVTAAAPAALNANGGTYIYLAIA